MVLPWRLSFDIGIMDSNSQEGKRRVSYGRVRLKEKCEKSLNLLLISLRLEKDGWRNLFKIIPNQ